VQTYLPETSWKFRFPPELQPFVEQEFATGMYSTREEVVLQAVCLLRDERAQSPAGIKEGLQDVNAGRTRTLEQAFEDIETDLETFR